jgi:tRNA-specific 2-thiouridylase
MTVPRGSKVLLAMSGGVDSSVAAVLLKEAGHEVVGCFMRHGDDAEDDAASVTTGHQGCCSVADACDARQVAAILDIPLYALNFKRDFGRVIDYFVDEYNAGRTPNPCIRCNDWLKFGRLADYARSIGASYVATGHYARVDPGGDACLRMGVDRDKDQSYVLFGTPRAMLNRMLLPVGHHRKAEIRRIAEEAGLPVYDKPDSQEICFVPDNDYMGLVRRRTPEKVREGAIVDGAGRELGRHAGHQQYTIGQRRGLSLSLGHAIYVVDKDADTNVITVGSPDATRSEGLSARETNWLVDLPLDRPTSCRVKIRANSDPVEAETRRREAGLDVHFAQPQRAVSPGQAVVCYDGDRVLGGGWIERAWPCREATAIAASDAAVASPATRR